MLLIYLSTAWMAGIYLASRLAAIPAAVETGMAGEIPPALWGLAALLPLSVAWLWRRQSRVRLAALCALFAVLGAARYTIALPRFDAHSVATYNDRGWSTLVGVVAGEPDVRDSYVNLRLRAETLAPDDGPPIDARGLVLVRAPRYPEIGYGDRLEVRGVLETPPVFEGFSYRDYLARNGIHSLVRWARIRTLERGQGNRLYALLLALKGRTQRVIAQVVPEPSAALLTGILLGIDNGLPPALAADFRSTGTSHIIAISGFNMAIVSGIASSLSVRLVGRRYAAWFASAAIALYTLFVGASAAVVRAAAMGCIAVWGAHFGRQNAAPNALLVAALLMTAWNPYTLWDVGFQLSFAATLGLILFADPLGRGFEALLARLLPVEWAERAARFLNEALVLTTCAQLTTMPITLYAFGTLSPVTLLSNVLVLPPQTQVMVWGAAATTGGLLWLPLGRFLGWVAWLPLAYTIWVVEATARLPHAAVDLGTVSPALVWGWYAALGGGAWLMAQTVERRRAIWRAVTDRLPTKALLGTLAVAALLAWLAVLALPDGKLHVTFLDVGQGDAVWIETPSGGQVVVNGGPSPSTMAAHVGQRMPFWDRSLDLAVLSDAREEHLGGLIAVLERYQVGGVLQGPGACARADCERWGALLQGQGLAAQQAVAGTVVDLGDGALLRVLHPPDGGTGEGAGPLVLRLDYGRTCFLLAGSAGQAEEGALLAGGEGLRCDVLQVGRQGGDEAFLAAVRPGLAVASCEEGEGEKTLARLNRHAGTAVCVGQYGSVEVISDGERYEVRVGR